MFKKFTSGLTGFARRWWCGEDGLAATEAAMIFPILLVMLLGTFDMGRGILANQKAIRASQVTADLITRNRDVSPTDISEAIQAGELALTPYNLDTYGVEIVSIRFDDDANAEVVWSEVYGDITPNPNVLTDVAALAEEGGGVVVVAVEYQFEPVFSGFVIGDIPMRETAFARGRKSAVVGLQ